MKKIITIQHPQSIHHTNGMVGSWTDWDLSELGIIQANNIARKLKEELNDDYVLYSSDLLRCRHTADIIGQYLDIKPIYKEELRERNLGKACGKTVAWLKENKQSDELTIDDRLFSDGESIKDAYNRLKPFYDELIESKDENIIIVSHGDLLNIFNVMFLEIGVEALNHISISGKSGGLSKMIIDDNHKHIIKCISDMSYYE